MSERHFDVPFELKAEDVSSDGKFRGLGSTFGGKPDSYGDIVVKGAFTDTLIKGGAQGLGIAMLWQHRQDEIPGVWEHLAETSKGLQAEGQLAINTELGNRALELLKLKAIKGLSIGFDTKEHEIVRTGTGNSEKRVRYLKAVDLWEISLVTFPANANATVTQVKELRNERDMERFLRDTGNLSKSAAQYVVSLCRPALIKLRDADEGDNSPMNLSPVLEALKELNTSLKIN